MFLSDLAVMLFSIVFMYMCILLCYWANKNDNISDMKRQLPVCRQAAAAAAVPIHTCQIS